MLYQDLELPFCVRCPFRPQVLPHAVHLESQFRDLGDESPVVADKPQELLQLFPSLGERPIHNLLHFGQDGLLEDFHSDVGGSAGSILLGWDGEYVAGDGVFLSSTLLQRLWRRQRRLSFSRFGTPLPLSSGVLFCLHRHRPRCLWGAL